MSLLKNKIKDFLLIEKPDTEINRSLILGEIFYFINQIPDIHIDETLSKLEFKHQDLDIRLISKENLNCNIYFGISDTRTVDIQIGKGGEYLYNQEMKDWSDITKLRNTLNDLFFNEISESLIRKNNKVVKATYIVPYNLYDQMNYYKFSIQFKFIFFVRKRDITETKYRPWIPSIANIP